MDIAQAQDLTVIRERNRVANTYNIGLNAKWDAAHNLEIEGDVSYAKATGDKPYDPYVLIGRYAQGGVGFSLDDSNNPIADLQDEVYTDPSLARVGYSGNWSQKIDDHILEGRLSAKWHSDGGILRGAEAGVDYQDHTKGLDNYNWNDDAYDTLTFPIDPSLLHTATFGNFMDGAVASPVPSYLSYDPHELMAWLSDPAQLNRRPDYSPTYLPGGSNYSKMADDLAAPGGPYALKYDPGGSFDTQERVLAGYIDTQWGGSWWSGNIGVRIVHVDTKSNGWGQTLQSVTAGASGNYTFTYSPAGPISSSASYTSFLPSANLKFSITDNMFLRLAASRTLTRADLNDLRYSVSWGGSNGQLTLNLGNPGLKPMYGKDLDASWEWYISRLSYVSVAGFRKDLTNLFGSATFSAPAAQYLPAGATGLPSTITVTQTQNLSKGWVQGVEVAAQFALDQRAGWLSGFGVSGNYTHVATNATDGCGVTGVSPDSYNVSGFYDNGTIQLRAAYNWRARWIMACQWDVTGQPEYHAPYGQIDLAARFNLTKSLQIFADVVNLTNEKSRLYVLDNIPIQQTLDYRRIDFGARVSF